VTVACRSLPIAGVVDAFEEGKGGRFWWSGGFETANGLDCHGAAVRGFQISFLAKMKSSQLSALCYSIGLFISWRIAPKSQAFTTMIVCGIDEMVDDIRQNTAAKTKWSLLDRWLEF
jgi:hypothetical protein